MALIELLFWEGCPSYPAALADLREAVGDAAEIVVREVVTEEDAEREGFVGSPTIRVDGEDLFPSDEPSGLACRLYVLRDGRISPTPDPALLREALASRLDDL